MRNYDGPLPLPLQVQKVIAFFGLLPGLIIFMPLRAGARGGCNFQRGRYT